MLLPSHETCLLVFTCESAVQRSPVIPAGIQPQAWFAAPATEKRTAAEEQAAAAASSGSVPALDASDMPHRRQIKDKAESGCLACWQLYIRYSRLRRWGRKFVPIAEPRIYL